MSTAVPAATVAPIPPAELKTRRQALGWSQNELARRIGRESGYVSKVINGIITSSVVWRQIHRALESEETRRRRRQKAAAS